MDSIGVCTTSARAHAPRAPHGSYVAIYRTLLAPDSRYRQVSATAQLAFLTLKLLLPFANIERHARWAAEIADNSSLSEDQASAALIELREAGIIQFDGKVLWVVQGLACEPTAMTCKVSAFLVKGLRRHLDNIGANVIADRFRAHYAALFADATSTTSAQDPSLDGSPDGSPDPSGVGVGVAEERGVGQMRKRSAPQWLDQITALLREKLGQVSPEIVEQRLASIAQRDGVERVVAVARHYFATCPPTFWSIRNLAERYGAFAAVMDGTGTSASHKHADALEAGSAFVSASQYLHELAAGNAILTGGADNE
jgi:hypothetical protein